MPEFFCVRDNNGKPAARNERGLEMDSPTLNFSFRVTPNIYFLYCEKRFQFLKCFG